MGRLGAACRDRWRLICHGSKLKSGRWEEDEDQKLVDLVETYIDGKFELVSSPSLIRIHTVVKCQIWERQIWTLAPQV